MKIIGFLIRFAFSVSLLLGGFVAAYGGPSVTVMFNNNGVPVTATSRYVEACTTGNLHIGALNKAVLKTANVPAMYINPGHNTISGRPGYGPVYGSITSCEKELQ